MPRYLVQNLPAPQTLVYDPLCGIVTFLGEKGCDKSDPEIFIVAAQSADLAVYGLTEEATRIVGSGAGLTYAEAFWAAAGETVERYCSRIVHGDEVIVASSKELCEEKRGAIGPSRWALFDPSQYATLPFPKFTDETKIAWTKAESLTHREECYVPACLVYLAPPKPGGLKDGGGIIAPAISTGLACADSRSEALLRGICEVIERDAFMIMWRNRLPCPRVVIDSESCIYDLFHDKFVRPGLEYTIVQTTLDLPFPSFFGILKNYRRDPPGVVVGGACDPDPNRAVLKTLLELVQGFHWMNHVGEREVLVDEHFSHITSFESRMELYAFTDQRAALEFFFAHSNELNLSQIALREGREVGENLHQCVEELGRRGIETIALDVTSSDVAACGLSVIKVLMPECEAMEGNHSMPFFGGRRWREVPVRLGLRDAMPSLQAVNKHPHPYP